jgi:hypothetical protein
LDVGLGSRQVAHYVLETTEDVVQIQVHTLHALVHEAIWTHVELDVWILLASLGELVMRVMLRTTLLSVLVILWLILPLSLLLLLTVLWLLLSVGRPILLSLILLLLKAGVKVAFVTIVILVLIRSITVDFFYFILVNMMSASIMVILLVSVRAVLLRSVSIGVRVTLEGLLWRLLLVNLVAVIHFVVLAFVVELTDNSQV